MGNRYRLYDSSYGHQELFGRIVAAVLIGLGLLAMGYYIYDMAKATNTVTSIDRASNAKNDGNARLGIPESSNTLEQKILDELVAFQDWLNQNNASGFVGELGWPHDASEEQWSLLASKWYDYASNHKLSTAIWATGSHWATDYQLTVYGASEEDKGLDKAYKQSVVLERYLKSGGSELHGINLAGLEFGESKLTSQNRGVPGQDYFYEPKTSYEYLSSRGIKMVRLPIRWERLQPILGGELDPSELTALRTQLKYAEASGIRVIIDLHNYGRYKTANGELVIGSQIGASELADFWQRLSESTRNDTALFGLGIMNEPHDLGNGGSSSAAKNWEEVTQEVLSELRRSGEKRHIYVSGYDWSGLADWSDNHPKGWIQDPASNFSYEAHHYWDTDATGWYQRTYDAILNDIQ